MPNNLETAQEQKHGKSAKILLREPTSTERRGVRSRSHPTWHHLSRRNYLKPGKRHQELSNCINREVCEFPVKATWLHSSRRNCLEPGTRHQELSKFIFFNALGIICISVFSSFSQQQNQHFKMRLSFLFAFLIASTSAFVPSASVGRSHSVAFVLAAEKNAPKKPVTKASPPKPPSKPSVKGPAPPKKK
jgi:hypothetical protein